VPRAIWRACARLRSAASIAVDEERSDVIHLVATGDEVAAEIRWSARLTAAVGALPAGGIMRAHLAMFLTWRDGKIVSQRNYDCFEPF
jgi:ketosteroid isomerase-like protein